MWWHRRSRDCCWGRARARSRHHRQSLRYSRRRDTFYRWGQPWLRKRRSRVPQCWWAGRVGGDGENLIGGAAAEIAGPGEGRVDDERQRAIVGADVETDGLTAEDVAAGDGAADSVGFLVKLRAVLADLAGGGGEQQVA